MFDTLMGWYFNQLRSNDAHYGKETLTLPLEGLCQEVKGKLYTLQHYYGSDAYYTLPVLMAQTLANLPEISHMGLQQLVKAAEAHTKYSHSVGVFDPDGVPVAGAVFSFGDNSVHAVGKIMYVDLFISFQDMAFSKMLMKRLYRVAAANGCDYIWTSRRISALQYRSRYQRVPSLKA